MTSANDASSAGLDQPQTLLATTPTTTNPTDNAEVEPVTTSTITPQVPLSEILKSADQSLATTPQTTAVANALAGPPKVSIQSDNFKAETGSRIDSLNYMLANLNAAETALIDEFNTRQADLVSDFNTRQASLHAQMDDVNKAIAAAQAVVVALS